MPLAQATLNLLLCSYAYFASGWHSRESWRPKHQGATLRHGGLTWIGHERRHAKR